MTTKSVALRMGKRKLRVSKISKYVIVQYQWRYLKGSQNGEYRLSIKGRADRADQAAGIVRYLEGWSFVFETETGTLLWENSPSEWLTLEQVIRNYESIRED